ncbi:MAG: hypothetical protein ACYC09_12740 [Bacteroidota bacterium]
MRVSLQIVSLALCSSLLLYSQTSSLVETEDAVEELLGNVDEEQDLSQRIDDLEYRMHHPVNIATAHYGDLLQIPNFSSMMAMELLLMRDTIEVSSPEQLLNLSAMTPELYSKIIPFIIADPPRSGVSSIDLLPTKVQTRTRVEQRLQMQKGVSEGKFLGDRNSAYQRIRIGNDRLEAGGVFEKDGGESYIDGHSAGYCAVNGIGIIQKLIAGTFAVSSAQGLVFARNMSPAKGSNTVSQTKIRSSGISPMASADEHRYFRGVAGQFDFNPIAITGFHSLRHMHATVDSNGMVSSYYTSGSFRTVNDRNKMNTLRETVSGGIIDYSFDETTLLAVALLHLKNDKLLMPSLFDYSGKKHISAVSLSGSTSWGTNDLFGEIASNDGVRFSKTIGVLYYVARNLQLSMHHRSFSKGYVNPLARPFGERLNIADGETGMYYGIQFRLGRLTVNGYIDSYTLPATVKNFGSSGSDVVIYCLYPISKRLKITVQIRNKQKNQIGIHFLDDERSQTNVRTEYSYVIVPTFQIRHRIECAAARYRPSRYSEKGFLTFLEARWDSKETALNIRSRMTVYDTDSFDSRLYQYESDVEGNFSNPPLYGKGIRWYFVAKYTLDAGIHFSIKYAETKKMFTNVIGSGDDEIRGSLDNSAVFQIDFKF